MSESREIRTMRHQARWRAIAELESISGTFWSDTEREMAKASEQLKKLDEFITWLKDELQD